MLDENKINFHYQAFSSPKNMNIDLYLQKLKSVQESSTYLQILDPTLIISERHLQIAIYHTLKSFEQKRNIARDKTTELLLRISGKNQISDAIRLYGVKPSTSIILIVAFSDHIRNNKEVIERFLKSIQISDEEEINIKFPLLSIKELSQKYQCEENLKEIEKRVLENMAALSVA